MIYGQLKYETLTNADGLSQGMVYDIIQDKEGFIWVATKDGLNRYDGYSFKVLTNEPNNNKSLSSNSINKLLEDSKGRIWVGTENDGLNIYDKKSGNFYRIKQAANGLSNNVIKLLEELPDGRMLVAAEDGKLNIIALNDNFFDHNEPPNITTIPMPNGTTVYGMGHDKNKQTWIGGMDGTVYQFDPQKNVFTLQPGLQLLNNGYLTSSNDILINGNLYLYNGITAIPLFDTNRKPEGNLLFRPNSKLWDKHHREPYYYDVSKWNKDRKIEWGYKLPEKRIIYPFLFDQSGLIWCGTVGYGLRKYDVDNDRFNAQMAGFTIYNIVPTSDSDIFLGDVGYTWKRLQNGTLKESAFDNLPQLTEIDNFLITKDGDYWFKSDNKGYFKYNLLSKKLTPYPSINNYKGMGSKQPMYEDSKNQIWFSGLGGNLMLFDIKTETITPLNINANAPKKQSEFAIVTAIHEDTQGIYWLGTVDGFVKVTFMQGNKNKPQIKWYYNNGSGNSLNYNHVSCFIDDPFNSNFLWIGTKGGGLNRLDKTTGNFLHLTVKEGLPDNVVYGLLSDDAGNIWGSTNKGIFCLSNTKAGKKDNWMFRNFTKDDGLQDNEFNTNAYKKMPNGNLAFGGVNGLNIFDPKEILAKNFKPQVFITNILVGNRPVSPNDQTGVLQNTIEHSNTIVLNYQQDILTLEFSSLDFTAPNQNKYRYQLVGVDKQWIESGTRRSATYLHLPAGSFVFKIQGSNSQGIWSDKIKELKIKVLPPWWRTWWAYMLYVLITGLAIRSYFKFRINEAKLQNDLYYQQQEAKRVKELDTLRTQLYTNITHEFRTPLTVILGMANQIKNGTGDHLQNGIEMILRNGNNLLNLVNEMLDLSKLEAGKMELHLVEGDVINFLRYLVESFHSVAENQNKKMHYLSSLDIFPTKYDAEKLRQILSNLLSNALKFTSEKGDIYVTISTSNLDTIKNTKQLIIKIKDTGNGIAKDHLPHIFDRFYQVDNSHTRKAEGTGIGLALTKELVQLMNGTIEVQSPPVGAKKGTEFTVTLPMHVLKDFEENNVHVPHEVNSLMRDESKPISSINHPFLESANEGSLVLLVEDNADVVAYTASCLPDYRLAVGKDGREGFDIACELIPDLIITDVMMPYMDGFEMTQKLRMDVRTSHIPIIMLTAKADMESKLEGIEHGAEAYLEKPFYKEELLLRIKKLLEQRRLLQKAYSRLVGIDQSKENNAIVQSEPLVEQATIQAIEIPVIENEFVKKVRAEIEKNIEDESYSVEQLSKNLFMSYSQVHRKLSAVIGYSPNQFIKLLRLEKAMTLLKTTDDTIANIAALCGFSDAGYFGKVFKQEYGMTPQEWRVKNSAIK